MPESIRSNRELIQDALDFGCAKAKVISTETISLAHWVKLQCQFGCSNHARLFTCPPFTPESEEMAEILEEYDQAFLFMQTRILTCRKLLFIWKPGLNKKDIKKLSLWVPNHVHYATLVQSLLFVSIQKKLDLLCKPVALMCKPQ